MTRNALLASIATQIQDYRQGEWSGPSPDHVERWVKQFEAGVQDAILAEIDHILHKTYITKQNATAFLESLATDAKVTGGDHSSFWQNAGILSIQAGGGSQREMLSVFDRVLTTKVGFGVDRCQATSGVYVYLDDAIFSGTRLRMDLESWLPNAPQDIYIHVIAMGLHRGGIWHARTRVEAAARALGKTIKLQFWRCIEIEDRRSEINNCDVLRPSGLPADALVQAYAAELVEQGFPPILRTQAGVGPLAIFTSPTSRELIEQEMLKAGAKIRDMCPRLPAAMRPLGFTGLRTLGFGAHVITYRNCPNNCPLAFWVGDPWYPLFPRKTNADSAASRGWG